MNPPITSKQKKILAGLLALSPTPQETLNYDGLTGYLFGVAITPDTIPPSEWIAPIFGGKRPVHRHSMEHRQEKMDCLMQAHKAFLDAALAGTLHFPFNIMALKQAEYDAVFSWVYGLNVALSMRPDIWDPEQSPELPEDQAYELMSSLMIIDGLLDPEIGTAYFEALSADILREAFGDTEADEEEIASRRLTILLASLPIAVETLLEFSRFMNTRRIEGASRKSNLIPLHRSGKAHDVTRCRNSNEKTCGHQAEGQLSIFPTENKPSSKKGQIIRGRFPGPIKHIPDPALVYQFKVSLVGIRPLIWRRIQVPGTASLADLHTIIQICMGWKDSHQHHFDIDDELYVQPSEEDHRPVNIRHDERSITLESLGARLHPSFLYVYDMGDYWEHQIELEKKLPPMDNAGRPKLLTGRRSCPPEDCGGVPSYLEQLKILNEPDHPDFKATLSQFGPGFRPDNFDKEDILRINERLRHLL